MNATLPPACDLARAECATPPRPPAHPRWLLACTILASSLAFIDGSVVNVGLPAIGRSLGAGAADLQWVINAYLLPLSALLLLGGGAGDRFGRRRLLIIGTMLFGATSLGCALAPDVASLLGARFLQGVSAALLMPNSLAILGASFEGEAKGRAVGIWAASGAALGALGPIIGGWLIDLGSWRGIFLLNLPVAAAAIVLAARYVPRDAPDRSQPLDLAGGLCATLGLGALTASLTLAAGTSTRSGASLGLAATALLALAAFALLERRRGERAMMPLAIFASRQVIGLNLLTLFLYGAIGAVFVLIPYLLLEAAGYSATAAGAALLPLPLVLSLTSPLMGSLAVRVGSRAPLLLGTLGVAAGFLLALSIGPQAAYFSEVLPALLIMSLGMSGAVAPLTTAILSSVPPAHTGVASGSNSAVARTGGLLATALLGRVLAAHGLPLVRAFHWAMLTCAAACVLAAVSGYLLLRRTPPPGRA